MTDDWLPTLSPSAGIKYQAIADALGRAVESGELRGGDRLPPQRMLAARLGVDLTTITRAYETARQRGLIEPRGRAGSFVRAPRALSLRDATQTDPGMNLPPELPGGIIARQLTDTASAILRDNGAGLLQYQRAGGAMPDRLAGAQLVARMALPADEQRIVVTAGGQNALHAILAVNFSAGDRIACGTHVYSGFKVLAERLGLSLVPLPEMTARALQAACRDAPIRALYVVPTNDNPTAATIPLVERGALAKVAADRGIQIIEDDAYGALLSEPVPAIASLVPELSWYIASTSKLISPALRVAFVCAPSVGAALRLAGDVHETTVMAPPLNVAIVSEWIRNGTFARLLGAMRAESRHRQSLAREHLAGLDYAGHPEGYHIWLPLPEGIGAASLDEMRQATGLTIIPSSHFAVAPEAGHAVRVSLGGALEPEMLVRGLRMLHGWAGVPETRTASLR